MGRNFIISLGLHAVVLLASFVWIPSLVRVASPPQILPVEIMTIDTFSRLVAAGKVYAKKTETKPNLPKFASKRSPNRATPLRPPAAQSNPALQKLQPDTRRLPYTRPNRANDSTFDSDHIRALLDKTPDTPRRSSERTANERKGDVSDERTKLTVSEIDTFRAQIQRCWNVSGGSRNAETMNVVVKLSLTPDGQIFSGPVIANQARMGNPVFRAAAESVLRAIRGCAPYDMPIEKYTSWRELELNFDPSVMLGG